MLSALAAAFFSQAAPADPPPPPVLVPYIQDGRFVPGDYGWMRGRFDDATPEQKAAAETIRVWLAACLAAGRAQTRAELAALGIPDAKLEQTGFRSPLCTAVAAAPTGIDQRAFAAFARDAETARPIAEGFLFATRLAEAAAQPRTEGTAQALYARTLGEQVLRGGLSWGEGDAADAPSLSPQVKAIVMSRLGVAVSTRDHANTQWLKALVDKEGWPSIAKVGAPASREAWLLVQHADADPAFQLRVLRLMTPLAAKGEVSRRDHAYLYDRVMLKIAGKQRYATQMTCRAGKRVPQPLEDASAVERWRGEAGLEPLAAYAASMEALFGPCPTD